MKAKKTKLIPGLLIDPFKQEIGIIEIANDPDVFRKVLRCDYFDCLCIDKEEEGNTKMDIWFDDEGRMYDQPLPRFKLTRGESCGGGDFDICGYGLILSSDEEGETIGLAVNPVGLAIWLQYCHLLFERTEDNPRFKGKDTEFFDQKMRTIELELPGQFRMVGHGEFSRVNLETEEET